MKEGKFLLRKRILSFKYAFNGLRVLLLQERNARIHVFAAILVVLAGFLFDLTQVEWLFVIIAIAFVFAMELLNSAIESLSDFITKDKHEVIKKVKDLAAGGVLMAALGALAIGVVIFVPKIIALIE